jgi:DNA (cytosine-5)-methyltransferase 1
MKNKHPDLIAPTRQLLRASGLHYVIENVEGAPLVDPFMLCGAMFGLRTYRHRIFETTFPVQLPGHPPHTAKTTKMGRAPKTGEMMHVVGHFSGVKEAREAMGIDWGTRETLREAIPPVYTKWIGSQMPV